MIARILNKHNIQLECNGNLLRKFKIFKNYLLHVIQCQIVIKNNKNHQRNSSVDQSTVCQPLRQHALSFLFMAKASSFADFIDYKNIRSNYLTPYIMRNLSLFHDTYTTTKNSLQHFRFVPTTRYVYSVSVGHLLD